MKNYLREIEISGVILMLIGCSATGSYNSNGASMPVA